MGFWAWLFRRGRKAAAASTPHKEQGAPRNGTVKAQGAQQIIPFHDGKAVTADLAAGVDYTLAKLQGGEEDLRLRLLRSNFDESRRGKLLETGLNVTAAMSSFAPTVNAALQAGQVVQIVGRPDLLNGLANGTMHLMANPHGATLMVQGTQGFAGHLNVGAVSATRLAGPLFVFQAMSFATGQYYFNRLDKQLTEVRLQLDRIEAHLRFEGIARLIAYRKEAERIAAELRLSLPEQGNDASFEAAVQRGNLGARVDGLVKQIDVELEQSLLWMDRFDNAVDDLLDLKAAGKKLDQELGKVQADLPRYEEAFALAGAWFDLAVGVQTLGRIHDARTGSARATLREGWRADYVERAEELAESTSFEDLLNVAGERASDFEGLIGWLKGLAKRGSKETAVTVRDRLAARAEDGLDDRESAVTDTITLVNVGGQVFAVASREVQSDESASGVDG